MRIGGGPRVPKLLIIGLDGATFDLVRPWVDEGKLPTFQRILAEGVHCKLASTIPPVTAPAWTSFMTGMNPAKHGLFDFVEARRGTYDLRYTNARSRMAKTVWQLLGEQGLSVGVINVPMTYPPEEVQGYMLSGIDAPENSCAITHPNQLYEELKQTFGKVSPQVRYLGYVNSDDRRDALVESLARLDEHYSRVAQYLLKRHPTDVAMVVFTSTDSAQHFFFQYLDPKHPLHDASRAAKYGEVILDVYRRLDRIIAELTAPLPPESAVMLVSDHGFCPNSGRVIHLSRFLESLSLLKRKGEGSWLRALGRRVVKRVDSLVRANLTHERKARLTELFPLLRTRWEAYSSGLAGIDWTETKAYCNEVLTVPSGIWINRVDLRPNGIVQPGRDCEELLGYLTRKLYELRDPVTGDQLVARIYRKEEIYHGPYLDQAPDLTLAWWEGVTFVAEPAFGPGPAVEYVGDRAAKAGQWGGTHALDGIFVARGGGLRRGVNLARAEIVDVVPTLLYLLGLPIPEDMDGRVCLEAFEEEFITRCGTPERAANAAPFEGVPAETYSKDEAELVEERLRGLGYIK